MSEADRLVILVGQKMELPTNETPLVINIEDASALDQRIFQGEVMPGDKILVYRLNGVVILYRPNTDKVINTASVPRGSSGEYDLDALREGLKPVAQPTLAIYIATDDAAWVAEVEAKLRQNFPTIVVDVRENAQQSHYQGLTIIDLTNRERRDLVDTLAQDMSATIGTALPVGERIPSSDIVLIIGAKPKTVE